MAFTFGFYNSLNHDRQYNAVQMASIFDGIIEDGVYETIGDCFSVTVNDDGTGVIVGTGRAWFNHTWNLNDTDMPLTLPDSDLLLNRYDAVIIEVNSNVASRTNSIKIISGTPSSNPAHPAMSNSDGLYQYPLCYILREAGSTAITQEDITNAVGTSECPFVIGVLKVMDIDMLVAQWSDQWNQWFANKTAEGNNDIENWLSEKQLEFNQWFSNLEVILSGDVATNLANQISNLTNQFDILAKEQAVYQTIDDSTGTPIEDSYNSDITGKIVYRIA